MLPQHDRGVAHRLGHRPGLIQRRGEGDDAVARAAAIGRLQADGAGDGGGLADRAAGVGAGGGEAQIARHRGRRTAGRTARHQIGVANLARRQGLNTGPKRAGLVGRAHGEFVHVGLAQHHRAGIPQILRHGGFIRRHEIAQDVAARRGAHALGAEQILDRQRQAFQRAALALRQPRIGRRRHLQRAFRRLGDEGVERPRAASTAATSAVVSSAEEIFCAFSASRASARVMEIGSLMRTR